MSLKPEAIIVSGQRFRCAKSGKRAFVTRRQAKDCAKGRKKRHGGRLMHVYWCSSCGGYHLTSADLSVSAGYELKDAFARVYARRSR
jgi:hypothetical protein